MSLSNLDEEYNDFFDTVDQWPDDITSEEQATKIREYLKEKQDGEKIAIIIVGFSGNGKTALAKKIADEYPEFKIVSWFDVLKEESEKYSENLFAAEETLGRKLTPEEITQFGYMEFGKKIDEEQDENLIIDGPFISLYDRIPLINTLRELGYRINIVDITETIKEKLIDKTLRLALDEYKKTYKDPVKDYKNDYRFVSIYIKVINSVMKNFKEEAEKSVIGFQRKYDLIGLGADKVLTETDSIDDMVKNHNKTI